MGSVSHVYSFKADLVPNDRIYLSAMVTYADVRTRMPAFDVPNLIDDYDGDYLTFMVSSRYAFNAETAATIGFSWTGVDNSQTNAGGQPLASDYDWLTVRAGVDHRLSDTISIRLEYSYTEFADDNYVDAVDYTAHAVFCSLTKEFK